MDTELKNHLKSLAFKYETKEFLDGDPSWFMHQVAGDTNKELLAFVASCLSYGSRKQFMPKIQLLLDYAQGDMAGWIANGRFKTDIPDDETRCYYRLYNYSTMHRMLCALQEMVNTYGSIRGYIIHNKTRLTCLETLELLVRFFSKRGITGIIPKDTKSSCKRLCMFLRWMVRSDSPVDLGIWSDIIDRRSLIIPLDTHVVQEANRLGLLQSKTTSMSTAIHLTDTLKEYFPDDPLKGDFALFGVGVNS